MNLARLFATILGVGIVVASAGSVAARPDGTQRLRGMDGRSFAVSVEGGPGGSFTNCYTFDGDGTWIDAAAPVTGTWSQDRVGTATTYSAQLLGGMVSQSGTVTPAGGGGVLQLEATTEVVAGLLGPEPLTLHSVGSEVESC